MNRCKFHISTLGKFILIMFFLFFISGNIWAYNTYPSTTCINSTVTYKTAPGQSSYSWSITGGTQGVDYTIAGNITNRDSIVVTWLTLGTRTLNATYVNTDIREAFKVTTIDQLSGTYTINAGGSGNFTSLKQVADIYNSCGLKAAVILQITSDIVETQTVFFKGTAPGSANYSLMITTNGNRYKVTGNINGAVISLLGANNITLDGINAVSKVNPGNGSNRLVIENTYNSSNVRSVSVLSDGLSKGRNVIIRNVEMYNSAAAVVDTVGVNNLAVSVDSITITGCYLHDANEILLAQNLKILNFSNNVVRNAKNTGLSIYNAITPNVFYTISGNDIRKVISPAGVTKVTDTLLLQGIFLRSIATGGVFTITNNTIDSIINTAPAAVVAGVFGIASETGGALNILQNTISNISSATTNLKFNTAGMQIAMAANSTAVLDRNNVSLVYGKNHPVGIEITSTYSTATATLTGSTISNITAESTISGNFASGIRFNLVGSISGSKISAVNALKGTTSGIYCDHNLGVSTLYNNMIFDIKGIQANGISLQGIGNNFYQVYHNSVRLIAANNATDVTTCLRIGGGSATSIEEGTNADVRNNLFSNEIPLGTQHYAIYVETFSGFSQAGNNRYYAVVNTGYYWWGARTLAGYKSFSGDYSSYIAKAPFVSATDLRLTSYPMGMRVPLIAGYTTDFDGNIRTYNNCSGNNMAGIDAADAEMSLKLTGNYTIAIPSTIVLNPDFTSLRQAADLYNQCGLLGATKFIISGDLEEAQVSEFLTTTGNSNTLTITTDNTIQRTVSASVGDDGVIKLNGAQNIVLDGLIPAKTGTNLLAVKNTYGEHNGVATIKVIGGSGIFIRNTEMYNTSRNTSGIANLLVNATNHGQGITVEGCYLHDANWNAQFLSYPYALFQLTFRNNKIANSTGIGLYINLPQLNPCVVTDNIFSNIVSNNDRGAEGVRGIYITSYAASNYTITGNTISKANSTANGNVSGIYLATDGTLNVKNNTISNIKSTVSGYDATGIDCQLSNYGASFPGIANIEKNTIDSISALNQPIGIKVSYLTGTPTDNDTAYIANNTVSNVIATNSLFVISGIQMNVLGAVSANKVYNITNSNAVGISANLNYSTSKIPLFVNNMIYGITASNLTGGIYLQGTASYKAYHNSINLTGANTSGFRACLMLDGTVKADVQNNLLVNQTTAGDYAYVIWANGAGPILTPQPYNRYYSSYTDKAYTIYYNNNWRGPGTVDAIATAAEYLSAPPTFSGTGLHLAGSSLTDGSLTVPLLASVVQDFDGDARSLCNNAAGADNNTAGLNITAITPSQLCEGFFTTLAVTGSIASSGAPTFQYSIDGLVWAVLDNPIAGTFTVPAQIFTAGTHILSIKDDNSCIANGNFTINPTPDVTISSDFVCAGETAKVNFKRVVTGTSANNALTITYQIGSDPTPKIVVMGVGDTVSTTFPIALDSVRVTVISVSDNVLTCTNTYSSQNPPSVNVSPFVVKKPTIEKTPADSIVCGPDGTSVTLKVDAYSGATRPVEYMWSRGDGTEIDCGLGCTNILSVSTTDRYIVEIIYNGCHSPLSDTNIIINPIPVAPTINASNNGVICGNNVVELSLTANGTYTDPEYTWYKQGTNGMSVVGIGNALAVNEIGNYSVRVKIRGCLSDYSETNEIVSTEVPTIEGITGIGTIRLNAICSNSNIDYEATSSVDGTTFSWIRPAIAGINDNIGRAASGAIISETLVNTTDAPIDVLYIFTLNAGSCSNIDTIIIKVNPLPTASIAVDNSIICDGDTIGVSITLTGITPWKVIYNDGTNDVIINNIESSPYVFYVHPSITTSYRMRSVTDANCTREYMIQL